MKSTGITRKVDELGRIVIPMEIRRTLGIVEKDPMEIFVEDDKVILKKYQPHQACMITGDVSERNCSLANGKIVLSPQDAELLIKELQQYLVK
ncbi:AbrB/MazE/SpoVT family DNA-binding domain-containing protein [Bacillus pseudomycoides]|uniref:AbrB/MazE/SpoVT family DNA-binding domain-containing protein n=1 Tax=Bacillus pseudomycoides TaxID=64104 RepID=UPI000BF4FF6B|nr:AbrB/MazE/SpoVT family DNA-binding domain-containing protein [Bacillus pseudomycoides]PGD73686.1 AbrB family transcriptional regulator [Bacillus pseudomycoides]